MSAGPEGQTLGEQQYGCIVMQSEVAAGPPLVILREGKTDAQLLAARFNAIEPFTAQKLTTHHTGLSLRVQLQLDRSWIHQQNGFRRIAGQG